MPFRRIRLEAGTPGAVLLHSMPGRLEPWADFLAAAQGARLARVACLTPLDEVASMSPSYHAAIVAQRLPFGWDALPMRNFGLAGNAEAFRSGIDSLAASVAAGEVVLLHCAAGIGRTGTAAACLLKRLGLPTPQALQRVRDAGSNPESALHSGLIDSF
jgi:atypical dual specificity phosphatase